MNIPEPNIWREPVRGIYLPGAEVIHSGRTLRVASAEVFDASG